MNEKIKTARGHPHPLGALKTNGSINFAIFSEHATTLSLFIFLPNERKEFFEITLDPHVHKTGYIWHLSLCGLPESFEYSYKIDGPKSLGFNPDIFLLDPYDVEINSPKKWGEHQLRRSSFPKESSFDWEGVTSPQIPLEQLIIYEMHVRGFTQDPSSQVKEPGTFLGLIEKIDYLKDLGINAIELMPIHEFDETEFQSRRPHLYNYWGYSPLHFFSLMGRYGTPDDFKKMVRELHRNGIEVILDVVFNHTGESVQNTYSLRGIDNPVYYLTNTDGKYQDFTGCGNTVNANHTVVRQMILDVLRYFVSELRIDGFRFDLASALTRGEKGTPLDIPPLIESIYYDPILSKTKLIAEAWDAAGLYQVGRFPRQGRWCEWNDRYRDTVRSFIKGTEGSCSSFATCLAGSEDIYGAHLSPNHSINFITCHDGFTLRDLVSYNQKHNEDNGENNQDGRNENVSWNCGTEGETKDPAILALRTRQMKNFFLALFTSMGTPMILMGDEYGHTRSGNNNAYCHDSRLNWFCWDELKKNQKLHHFLKALIHFYRKQPVFNRKTFLTPSDVDWHGTAPFQPNWGPQNHLVALTLKGHSMSSDLYLAFNAGEDSLELTLPEPPPGKKWIRIADTALEAPEDFQEEIEKGTPLNQTYGLVSYAALLAIAL